MQLSETKILVVEDDPGIVVLLESFFASQGATVFVERTGKDVQERIEELQPDIAILDVIMPFVDGFTVLEKLRDSGNTVPVILLTDKKSIDDKVKGLGYGADDYMTKPFSTQELLARVKSVLRRTREVEGKEQRKKISVGSLTVEPLSREVLMGNGEKIKFTKTEFDLFCYLSVKKTEVVSHKSLLNEVLGYKSDVETKALVMHVANMRKKMAIHCIENVKIETVAGVGYKLVEMESV